MSDSKPVGIPEIGGFRVEADRLGEVDLFPLEQVNAILNFRIEVSIHRLIADIDSESQLAVVGEGAEIPLCVGIEPGVEKLGDDIALYLEGARRNVHHLVEPPVEVRFIGRKIGEY